MIRTIPIGFEMHFLNNSVIPANITNCKTASWTMFCCCEHNSKTNLEDHKKNSHLKPTIKPKSQYLIGQNRNLVA